MRTYFDACKTMEADPLYMVKNASAFLVKTLLGPHEWDPRKIEWKEKFKDLQAAYDEPDPNEAYMTIGGALLGGLLGAGTGPYVIPGLKSPEARIIGGTTGGLAGTALGHLLTRKLKG